MEEILAATSEGRGRRKEGRGKERSKKGGGVKAEIVESRQ